MEKHYLVVVGHEHLIRALMQANNDASLEFGEPRSAEGFADAVDSALGPDEIRQIFELVTVGASTGTAVVTLFQKIKSLLHSTDKVPAAAREVFIKDARTGKVLETLKPDSDVDAAAARIDKE